MGQQVNVYQSLNYFDSIGGKSQTITAPTQWFTEQSSTMQYPIGTRLVVDDMVFHYGHAAEYATATNSRGRGQANLGKQANANHAGNGHITGLCATTAAAAMSTSPTLDGSYAAIADEFKDGAIFMRDYGYTGPLYGRIRTNDATSTTTKFYLKEGLQVALTANATAICKVHWNQYAHFGKPKTNSPISKKTAQMGCLWVTTTEDYYAWLQTWGPYMCQSGETGTGDPGLGQYNSAVYFDPYGGFTNPGANASTGEGYHAQLAGFVIGGRYIADSASTSWSPWVMLQISPV